VVAPPDEDAAPSAETVDAMLRTALDSASLKDAVAAVTEASGLPRRDVYKRALELTRKV
jgi:16S rRNA (cytidine1402-2'-O)-methyltransferase